MPELWNQALAEVKERIGKQNYDAWIKPIRFVSRNKSEIKLEVPNKFFRDWLTEHYLSKFEDVLISLAKDSVRFVFKVNERLKAGLLVDRGIKKKKTAKDRSEIPT